MADLKKEGTALALMAAVFLACFYLPLGTDRTDGAALEALRLVQWYAREHVLLCLLPAFFIAGAISVFVGKASVMRYLGAGADKVLAYGVASVSGSILAVCSCTVLPLFAGIYRMGAGLGPASAFLYSGPAVNVLAIILTARILGLEFGIARAAGAIIFSVVIGLLMHLFFRREELEKAKVQAALPDQEIMRPLWQNVLHLAAMVAVVVCATWGRPESDAGFWYAVWTFKWPRAAGAALSLCAVLVAWFGLEPWRIVPAALPAALLALLVPQDPRVAFAAGVVGLSAVTATQKGEMAGWFSASWGFARQILPLLFLGVLLAGALLGRPGHEGLIPAEWISRSVGGNGIGANLFASVAGAFMYFATLTEVPILQGLIGSGMGKGPALALLLAGPALSLPNMLVIRSVLGMRKTLVYILLVVVMAAVTGIVFGILFG